MDLKPTPNPLPEPDPSRAADCNEGDAELGALLEVCVREDASDLHLSPDNPVWLRVHGHLEPRPEVFGAMLDDAMIERIADALAQRGNVHWCEQRGSVDGALVSPSGARFRFNLFRRQGRRAVALRRLEDRFRSLQELGLPDSLYQLCDLPDGLVVVAGPTGAGKSTTLATLIDRINQNRRCHIVTIEDPIEYLHTPIQSLVNQRQVGADAPSFNEALVAALRQDPDVILVGEIRDLVTISTAITAAETGHLVFTTVHAGDCVGAIERLVSVFPAEQQVGIRKQLSLVLRCVVAQHLLVADGPRSRARDESSTPSALVQAEGASAAGRRQRVAMSEVLMVNSAIANLIAQGKSSQIYSAIETGTGDGMQTMEHNAAQLMVSGQISEAAAMSVARQPQMVRERARMLRQRGFVPNGGGR